MRPIFHREPIPDVKRPVLASPVFLGNYCFRTSVNGGAARAGIKCTVVQEKWVARVLFRRTWV